MESFFYLHGKYFNFYIQIHPCEIPENQLYFRSVGREGLAVTSLLELGEVCEREREKFNENNEETTTPFQPNTMKPPTPVSLLRDVYNN